MYNPDKNENVELSSQVVLNCKFIKTQILKNVIVYREQGFVFNYLARFSLILTVNQNLIYLWYSFHHN